MYRVICLILFFYGNLFANSSAMYLTETEKEWIEEHPVINVGGELDWAPFDFVDSNGIYGGLSKDYLDEIANIAGFKVKYHTGKTWTELLSSLKSGEIDMLPALYKNKEREEFIEFTSSYLTLPEYIFTTNENANLNSLERLRGHTIVQVKGYSVISWIRKNYPDIKIIEKSSILECLQSIKAGEGVAFIGDNPSTTYNIKKNFITDIRLNSIVNSRKPIKLYMGIKKEYVVLAGIINKIIRNDMKENFSKISNKWMKVIENKNLILTKNEQKWMGNNPITRIAVMDYWPHDKNGDSLHTEVLKLINYYSGLHLVPIKFKGWKDGYEKAKNGIDVDGIMGLSWSKDRESFFSYTSAYNFSPAYLVTRKDNITINSLKDLNNRTVLLQENEITNQLLEEKSPSTNVINLDSLGTMYKRFLKDSDVDAMFSYFLDEELLEEYDFKIVEELYDRYGEVAIGINNSQKVLSSIINKTFKIIPKNELSFLRDKDWGNKKNKTKLSRKELEYIEKTKVLKVCINPDWEPIEFKKDGIVQGISIDILNIIKEKLNIEYDFIRTTSWSQSQEFLKDKKCDLLPSTIKTAERLSYANLTQPYLKYKLAIITQDDQPLISSLESINSKVMSYKKGSEVILTLKNMYTGIDIKETSSYLESLENVIDKDTYFTLSTLPAFSYFKSKYELNDLQVAGYTNLKYNLSMAVENDNKILLNILNKTLQTISKSTFNVIQDKWSTAMIVKRTDWLFLSKIFTFILVILIGILFYNRKLNTMVREKTKDINEQKEELLLLMTSLDKNVMYSKTDLVGKITHVSDAFCKISGYSKKELIGKKDSIVRHSNMTTTLFTEMWETLRQENSYQFEIMNKKKDGTTYWIKAFLEPEYNLDKNLIGYSTLMQDITDKKAIEELSKDLEVKVASRTHELSMQKKQVEIILDNIMLPVLITSKSKRVILYANKYAEIQYELPVDKIIGNNIDNIYTVENQKDLILNELKEKGYVENLEQHYKTYKGKEFIGLLSVKPIVYNNEEAYIGMTTDISYQKKIEEEIREVHKQTRDSIEYASLIQHSLIPKNDIFMKYFQEYFTIWHPKDVVGGDIYLFEELRNEDECLIMVIDCTGHGVPGAFVTMLVKAIERQIVATIKHNKDEIVSPGKLLGIFNRSMKHLLQQEDEYSVSNAGFDGGILYYNKKDKIIKFSGAETPLFYTDKDNQLHTIKGNRHSIGYKKCNSDFEFKDHTIEVSEGMNFYLATDGYSDQNGGTKGFPFGKKRFTNIINEYMNESFADQQEILLDELALYQGDEDRNDDVTLIGFKI
jgi:PAS domain S-box-containing protein